MSLLALLIFVAVFALAAALLGSTGKNQAKEFKKTLDTALKSSAGPQVENLTDVQKITVLSAIPWLNTLLDGTHPALALRRFLDQADLQWTPSRAVLTAAAGWAIPAYLIYLRTGMALVSLLLALPGGALPVYYIYQKRR